MSYDYFSKERMQYILSKLKNILDDKQNKLTAGNNITIENNVISAEDDVVILTKAEYDALPDTKLTDGKQYFIKDYSEESEAYIKPDGGIPKTDLASSVQTSLNKADTALQSHQDISGKQDKLTAGTNITIENNVISASGGGSSIDVIDNLISTTSTSALSANQGKVLNDKIETTTSNVKSIVSDSYNSSTTYSVGDYVIYNNNLYKCILQCNGIIPTDTTYWEQTSVSREVGGVRLGFFEDGSAGYYKAGADTLTPFKSGGSAMTLIAKGSGALSGNISSIFSNYLELTSNDFCVVITDLPNASASRSITSTGTMNVKLEGFTTPDVTYDSSTGDWSLPAIQASGYGQLIYGARATGTAYVEVYVCNGDRASQQVITPLWTNSAPSSTFSAQTLELDLSNYAGVIIAFKASAAYAVSSAYPLSYWFFPIPSDGSGYARRITCGWVNNSYSKANRLVTVSKTGIVFEGGRTDTTTNGIYAVPIEIQVVK